MCLLWGQKRRLDRAPINSGLPLWACLEAATSGPRSITTQPPHWRSVEEIGHVEAEYLGDLKVDQQLDTTLAKSTCIFTLQSFNSGTIIALTMIFSEWP
jgi:hypothetical protein